jgi:hypothetical protein
MGLPDQAEREPEMASADAWLVKRDWKEWRYISGNFLHDGRKMLSQPSRGPDGGAIEPSGLRTCRRSVM